MAPGLRSRLLFSAVCALGGAYHQRASAQTSLAEDIAPLAGSEATSEPVAVAEDESAGAHRSNAGGPLGVAVRAAASREHAAARRARAAEAAELLAGPAFVRAEAGRVAFADLHFEVPVHSGAPEVVDSLFAALRRAFSEAGSISADYTLATQGTDRDRTIAALVGSGQVWDTLARALHLSAPPPPFPPGITLIDAAPRPWAPAGGLDASTSPLPSDRDADAAYRSAVEIVDAVQRAFDPWTRAVECVAVGRYALAARAARMSSVRSPAIEIAWARLASYSDERLGQCIEVVRTGDTAHGIIGDPTFGRYSRGEFYRAPLGVTGEAPTATPTLDTLE